MPGFLDDRLKPMGGTDATVEVVRIGAARCDIISQRLERIPTADSSVPAEIKPWYAGMTDPLAIPDTTVLLAVSLADTVNGEVFRHKATEVLVQPPAGYRETWTAEARAWLDENFEPDPPRVADIAQALRDISRRLEPCDADLVVFNTSTFVPDEKVYWFDQGKPDTISVRASRMNLVADKLVKELDITLVDVDRVTAEIGGRRAVAGPARYTPETFDALAQETVAMILDLERISSMFASDVMQLNVPGYDRRTATATLTRWYVAPDAEISKGDVLFDLRFGNVRTKLKDHGRETGRAIELSVVAGRSGFLDSIAASPGTELSVGARVGVVTAQRGAVLEDIETAARFPVGVKEVGRDDR
jgi:hypothetical protein